LKKVMSYEQKVKSGWYVVQDGRYVMSSFLDGEDKDSPKVFSSPYQYDLGLTYKEKPEIILCGFSFDRPERDR